MPNTRLAPWTELHIEPCRSGRRFVLAVNHRDASAFQLDADGEQVWHALDAGIADDAIATREAEQRWLADLREHGFLTDRPANLDVTVPAATVRQRVARILRTLDVHSTRVHQLVAGLYRGGLRHAFHPVAVALQIALALSGAVAVFATFTSGANVHLRVAPADLPIVLALSLFAVAVHELGHALVIVHHGRTVRAAGFRLHLGSPAFYVESVDAALMPRGARMVQAAAGPWAEWLVTSVVAVAFRARPDVLFSAVLARFVILNTLTIASNLLPFVGLDGSLLLADAIREPDLPQRSRAAAGAVLRGEATRNDIAFAAYAALNAAVAAALFALAGFMWFELFSGLLGALVRLGPVGAAAAAGILAVLFRPAVAAWSQPLRAVLSTARFRLERRWRVAATRQLATLPALAGMNELALSIVAGQLIAADDANAAVGSLSVRLGGRVIVLPPSGLRLARQACTASV